MVSHAPCPTSWLRSRRPRGKLTTQHDVPMLCASVAAVAQTAGEVDNAARCAHALREHGYTLRERGDDWRSRFAQQCGEPSEQPGTSRCGAVGRRFPIDIVNVVGIVPNAQTEISGG